MARGFLSFGLTLTILALLALAGPSDAQVGNQEATQSVFQKDMQPEGDFKFVLAPYAWLTSINGTVGFRKITTDVNASFTDLAKYMNFGTMIHGDVLYRDTVGLLGEFNLALLGEQASGKRVSIDGKMGLIISDIDGYYRVGTFALGKNGGCPTSFDLLGGVRIWSLGARIKSQSSMNHRDVFKQTTWADPIVGARALFHLTDKWSLDFRGGVGGFGASSAFTWDAMAVVGYSFWAHCSVMFGYRAVSVNHSQGSGKDYFKFDATLNGPVLALVFTF